MKAVVWDDEALGANFHDEEIPADLIDQAQEYRERSSSWRSRSTRPRWRPISKASMPSEETLKALIRKGTIHNVFVPILCGSAFKNKGVQPMLDAVVDYLPSPLDVPPMKGIDVKTGEEATRAPSDDEPLVACSPSRS